MGDVRHAAVADFRHVVVENLMKFRAWRKMFPEKSEEKFADRGLDVAAVRRVEPHDVAFPLPLFVGRFLSALLRKCILRLTRPYNTSAHCSIGEMQIVNRPRKEGPSKNVMLLSWTAQVLFTWTRTHHEPRKSGTCGYIAAGLLRADVSSGYRAPARFWTVGAKPSLLDACFRVFACCTKKRKFSTLSLRSAVENGSFPRSSCLPSGLRCIAMQLD